MDLRTRTPRLGGLPLRGLRRGSERPLAADPETGLPGAVELRAELDAGSGPRTLQLVGLEVSDGCGAEWLVEDPELPRRMAAALRSAVRPLGASPYRLDGLLFAVLGPAQPAHDVGLTAAREAAAGAAGALAHAMVHGEASLPQDGAGSAALGVALRRLRGRARRQGRSPERQLRDVLLALLAERRAGGSPISMPDVASHAVGVGRKLGLSLEQLDDVVRAAELQDIGKLVVPESILTKRAPLTEEEWAVVRGHPLIAERVIAAAPALVPVARLVRSCAERWDGSGYPDGLRAEEIPLGSRIIAVCVAFDAMTSPRPYRDPLAPADAFGELCRCAGRQFDPMFVAAFCATTAELIAPAAVPGTASGKAPNNSTAIPA